MKITIVLLFGIFILILCRAESDNVCDSGVLKKMYCSCSNKDTDVSCKKLIAMVPIPTNDQDWQYLQTIKTIKILRFRVYIEYIPSYIFPSFDKLTVIQFHNSSVTKVQSYAFIGLQQLVEIYLFENRIEVIEKNAFQDLPALKNIFLHSNKIIEVDGSAFVNLPILSMLTLDKSQIQKIHPGTFRDLKSLKILNLSNNLLETFEAFLLEEIIENFMSPESRLNLLIGNSIKCDQNLLWMSDLAHKTRSEQIRIEFDNFNCKIPRISTTKKPTLSPFNLFPFIVNNIYQSNGTSKTVFSPTKNPTETTQPFNLFPFIVNNIYNPNMKNLNITVNYNYG